MKTRIFLTAAAATALLFTACQKEEAEPLGAFQGGIPSPLDKSIEISPDDSTIERLAPLATQYLSWNAVAGALGYELSIVEAHQPGYRLADKFSTKANEIRIAGLQYDTEYKVEIKAILPGGKTGMAQELRFKTDSNQLSPDSEASQLEDAQGAIPALPK